MVASPFAAFCQTIGVLLSLRPQCKTRVLPLIRMVHGCRIFLNLKKKPETKSKKKYQQITKKSINKIKCAGESKHTYIKYQNWLTESFSYTVGFTVSEGVLRFFLISSSWWCNFTENYLKKKKKTEKMNQKERSE